MYRRTFLQGVGGLTIGSSLSARRSGECDCEFCGTVEASEGEIGIAGAPDFTVESDEKTHRVYWRPKSHFADRFSPFTHAYAAIGGDYMVLNTDLEDAIDSRIVAHEVGHNLGYRHIGDSLMAPYVGGMTDRDPDRPLATPTLEVFRAIDGVTVTDWDQSDVLRLIAAYNEGPVTLDAALYGISRYNEGEGPDAYYRTLGDQSSDTRDISLAGRFYRYR